MSSLKCGWENLLYYLKRALWAAAARPFLVADPRTVGARPHRNACQLHGLTGQWTHLSRACPADGASTGR